MSKLFCSFCACRWFKTVLRKVLLLDVSSVFKKRAGAKNGVGVGCDCEQPWGPNLGTLIGRAREKIASKAHSDFVQKPPSFLAPSIKTTQSVQYQHCYHRLGPISNCELNFLFVTSFAVVIKPQFNTHRVKNF